MTDNMNGNSSTLREALNEVKLEGILKKMSLKTYTSQYGDSIMGDIVIMTGDSNEHKVHVKANKMTWGSPEKPSKENADYKGLLKVMAEYVSVASLMEQGIPFDDAVAQATKLRTKDAKLGLNEYYNDRADGNLSSNPAISCRRFTRIDDGKMTPQCHFEIEGFFDKIRPETKNGEETGRLLLDLIVPMYGGAVEPLTFVTTPDTSDYFSSHYDPKRTGKIFGNVIDSFTTTTVTKEGFMKNEVAEVHSRVNELLVDNGDPAQYDEDDVRAYPLAAIQAAMKVRENETLPEIIRKGKEKGDSSSGGGFAGKSSAGGFAAKNQGVATAASAGKPPFSFNQVKY